MLSSTLFCFFPLILFFSLNQLTEKKKKKNFLSSPFLSLGETTGIARRREESRRNYYNYRRSHRLFVGNNASWEERKFEKKEKKLETPIHFFFLIILIDLCELNILRWMWLDRRKQKGKEEDKREGELFSLSLSFFCVEHRLYFLKVMNFRRSILHKVLFFF